MKVKDAMTVYKNMKEGILYSFLDFQKEFNWSESRVKAICNKLEFWGYITKVNNSYFKKKVD